MRPTFVYVYLCLPTSPNKKRGYYIAMGWYRLEYIPEKPGEGQSPSCRQLVIITDFRYCFSSQVGLG